MSVISQLSEQSTYLNASDAAKHLNYRSLDLAGESLNLTTEKVQELAQSRKLKYSKTAENSRYLFKVSSLEKYLKKQHGQIYSKPDAFQNRFTEYSTRENVPGSDVELNPPIVNSFSAPKDVSAVNFLHGIKNSPPLIYLSALMIGFAAGTGTNIGSSLIEMGYFSDRISITSNPIDNNTAFRIAGAIEKEEPETALGNLVRQLEVKSKGPFKPMEKNLRVYFLDASNLDSNSNLHTYVIEHAAAVCNDSTILNSKILINGENIVKPGNSARGLVVFNAFLKDKTVCAFKQSDSQFESVIVNRTTFDEKFNINTENQEFVDVVAYIDNM